MWLATACTNFVNSLGWLSSFSSLPITRLWVASGLIALVNVGLVYVGVKLFQRETILTRWK